MLEPAARMAVTREPPDVRCEQGTYVTQKVVVPTNLRTRGGGRLEDLSVLGYSGVGAHVDDDARPVGHRDEEVGRVLVRA